MTGFYDLHCHILPGIDDGAENFERTCKMLDMAFSDGIRYICATPHYNPYRDMTDTGSIPELAERVRGYLADRNMNIELKTGSEVMYHSDCVKGLENGECLTMCGSKLVMVEFGFDCTYADIKSAVIKLHSHGFQSVLAHIDRYPCVYGKPSDIDELYSLGAVLQFSTKLIKYATFAGFLKNSKRHSFSKYIIKNRLPGFVASDAHDTEYRKPVLSECYKKTARLCGGEYADLLFFDIPSQIFGFND